MNSVELIQPQQCELPKDVVVWRRQIGATQLKEESVAQIWNEEIADSFLKIIRRVVGERADNESSQDMRAITCTSSVGYAWHFGAFFIEEVSYHLIRRLAAFADGKGSDGKTT